MATHTVTLTVVIQMDEMDGTPYQSAEVAHDLVSEALAEQWGHDPEIVVDRYTITIINAN